jgi:tetratricopeptide (TPR) repeat protein
MPEPAYWGRTNGMILCVLLLCGFGSGIAFAQSADSLRVATAPAMQPLLAEAESLLANGQSKQAYELLQPQEAEYAGHVLYDYLLGIAALDSGRSSEAIFSLRRAIAVSPDFSGAKMELARAYYESGNPELARPLFTQLLGENPPPAVAAVINQYLQTIDSRDATPSRRFFPYVGLFAGYDTNANGSTDNQQFLGFTLSPDNVQTESGFAELNAGFNAYIPRSSQFAWIFNGRASHRANFDASFVDATIISGLGGFNWQRDAWFGRAALDGFWGSRDGNPNETYLGVDAILGRRINELWDVTAGIRGGAQRYDDTLSVLDVNRFLYSLGVNRHFASRAQIGAQLIGGNDNEVQSGSPYGNAKFGGRISVASPVGTSTWMSAALGVLESDYDGLFFGSARKDTQWTAVLQFEFRDVLTRGLSVTPRVRYVENDSDVELYSYDRTEMGIDVRWIPQP